MIIKEGRDDMQGPDQQGYQQQPGMPQQYIIQEPLAPIVSVKEWLITTLILIIPIVNIIMMFVWAFGGGNPSKANYFKAALIWAAIVTVIYIIVGSFFLKLFIDAISAL